MENENLFNSLKDLQNSKDEKIIYGSLGIPLSGAKIVEVANRSGYVYVRLRDNQNEVIQAFNDTVSPVYDLPVTLVRRGNKYAIKGRDINRYQNWGTQSAFLPRHGNQHSFTAESGGGGDVTFVYGKQFVPALVIPSGTNGAGNVVVSEYVLQEAAGWKYIGNTGTQDLLGYKPTGSSAVMVLVYLDKTSGNPEVLVGSGTYFSSSITGTAQVLPYIPALSSPDRIADFAVRLVSGTRSIGWDNLYDVRQYFGSLNTGSSGGGGGSSAMVFWDDGVPVGTGTILNVVGANVDISVSGSVARLFVTGSSGSGVPTFITGSVPYAGSDGTLKEHNSQFYYDEITESLWLGGPKQSVPFVNRSTPIVFAPTGSNTTVSSVGYAIGTGTSGSPTYSVNGYRARGTLSAPTPVQSGDALLTIIGGGYDGVTWQNASRIRPYADGNWITGTHLPTRWDFEVTPSGSATRRVGMSLYGDSLNLTNTGTYNINGIPHSHERTILTANRTYYVRKDGSDTNDGLTDSSGGAFLTASKVNDIIGTIDKNGYNVDAYFSTGTWGESITVKTGIGDGTVTWHGTLVTTEAVSSATVAAGSGATQGTVTKTGQFTGDNYEGYIAYFQTDNVYRIIESNTNNALTLADIAASSTTQNVDVKTWGTAINKITLPTGLTGFVLDQIDLTGTGETYSLEMLAYSALEAQNCKFEKQTFIQGGNLKEIRDSYFVTTAAGTAIINLAYNAGGVIIRCYIKANNDTAQGVSITRASSFLFAGGSINGIAGVNKATYGVRAWGSSTIQCNGAGGGFLKVKNCDIGVRADSVASIVGTANNTYSGNGANESADGTTFGYID